MQEQKKEGCDFAFYTFAIFLGSWKRSYFSMDLWRDFSLAWVRAGRSAVGQHGLCSRLLLFSAVLSHLRSHTELIFACSRALHSQNMLLAQNKHVCSLETESLSRMWGKERSKEETWDATGKQWAKEGGSCIILKTRSCLWALVEMHFKNPSGDGDRIPSPVKRRCRSGGGASWGCLRCCSWAGGAGGKRRGLLAWQLSGLCSCGRKEKRGV